MTSRWATITWATGQKVDTYTGLNIISLPQLLKGLTYCKKALLQENTTSSHTLGSSHWKVASCLKIINLEIFRPLIKRNSVFENKAT